MSTASYSLRLARPDDCDVIAALIFELATYEKLEHEAKATGDGLRAQMFGPRPYAEAFVAEADGRIVGFALFFHSFSTFRCKPSLYLEDLYVQPAYRSRGIGKALFTSCAKLAAERDCGRMEWSVLDWNEPSIGFYRSLGARPMSDWTVYRLDDEALAAAASLAP